MKGLRRGLVACVVAGALVAPGATAQPVEAGAVPGWRTVIACMEAAAEWVQGLFSASEGWPPEHDGAAGRSPSQEEEGGTTLSVRRGESEVHPSFDPDG